MGQRGASLIEVVVVLAITAMLIGFAEPLVSIAARQQARAGETALASELRMARHLALTHRERIKVTFDGASNRMIVERSPEAGGGRVREWDLNQHGLAVDALSNGNAIYFYPSGRTATPTTITLKTRQRETRRLTVSLTGRVTIVRSS